MSSLFPSTSIGRWTLWYEETSERGQRYLCSSQITFELPQNDPDIGDWIRDAKLLQTSQKTTRTSTEVRYSRCTTTHLRHARMQIWMFLRRSPELVTAPQLRHISIDSSPSFHAEQSSFTSQAHHTLRSNPKFYRPTTF